MLREILFHFPGLKGVVVDSQCVGQVESIVTVDIGGKPEKIFTRDDCIDGQRVNLGDKVKVQKRLGTIFPPKIKRV